MLSQIIHPYLPSNLYDYRNVSVVSYIFGFMNLRSILTVGFGYPDMGP